MKVSSLECSKKPELFVPSGAGLETTILHMLGMDSEWSQSWAYLTFSVFTCQEYFKIFGLEISIPCFMRYWYNRKKQSKTKQKIFFTRHINIRFNEGRWSSGFLQRAHVGRTCPLLPQFKYSCHLSTCVQLIQALFSLCRFEKHLCSCCCRHGHQEKSDTLHSRDFTMKKQGSLSFLQQTFPAVLRMEPKASLTVGTTGRCSTTERHLSPSNKTLLRSFETLVNNLGWFYMCIFQTVMWHQG